MNHAQVLEGIAKFTNYGECVVVKQKDWDNLVSWVKKLNVDDTERPNFDILPVIFHKDEDND